jgi:hypothetical protein
VALVFNFLISGRTAARVGHPAGAGARRGGLPQPALLRFTHSAIYDMLRAISAGCGGGHHHRPWRRHGKRAALVYGNRETSTNLRYKYGTNLVTDEKMALVAKNPMDINLPNDFLNKNYVLAKEDYYFVYPTHFHEYERQYKNSFQHGGISLEEMLLPVITMTPKR